MKIETCVSHEYLDSYNKDDKTIIVIDTLRATSVMVTAMNNGAKSLRVIESVEDTFKVRDENHKMNYILGGEREGLKIEGFDLSNSPLDYKKDIVGNRNILMTTSNGTKTMIKVGLGREVLIGSLINYKAVANEAIKRGKDILIVNAGTKGKLSLEDFITGGAIAGEISGGDYCDVTLASILTFRNKEWRNLIKKGLHYKRMVELGFFKDLEYCLKESLIDMVPIMKDFLIE